MFSICIDGEDASSKVRDWSIYWCPKVSALKIKCNFDFGRVCRKLLSSCEISPSRDLGEMLLIRTGSSIASPVFKVTILGEKYAIVQYCDGARPYVFKMSDINLIAPSAIEKFPAFHYFTAVAKARQDRAASDQDRVISSNVVRQLQSLPARSDTALHAYCTGSNGTQMPDKALIFPFGLNESQLRAVERAFQAQISVIEGPPGTGKTQTILNILANIVLRGKTVAVLSNNNAAVENVYEKLEKCGLGHLVAKLGNQVNRTDFFADPPQVPSGDAAPAPTLDEIQSQLSRLKQHLRDHNRSAQLQAELDELRTEQRLLRKWQEDNGVQPTASLNKYGLSPSKAADLMAYLAYLGERRVGFKDRIELLFNYKIFRARPFAQGQARLSVFHALQMHFYEKALYEKEAELQACLASLANANFEASLETLKTASMLHLKQHLHGSSKVLDHFDAKNYRKNFDAFVKRFPILGSGTHSIVNSIASGAILDYAIVDEASQQDIVPGILALGCAKNLIVVGDSRQLAHIPVELNLQAPADAYDCERNSLLDSCIAVFGAALPKTLLKEHYRCHPRIIQFCNQQFYDNTLIPMTPCDGEEPLRMVVTAKGNHARQNTNLRELDSLLNVLDKEGEPVGLDGDGRGFIAPFRAQITLSNKVLPADFVKETVHKFQGRECEEIVFSTVLDKKRYNQEHKRLEFVDDPRMVNVAVSRAKRRFTLVTGDEVFSGNNGHIAALIRYVNYYGREEQVVYAPVVSAFDLLYREYDQSLARLNARLRPEDSRYKSEQIAAQLLRQALTIPAYRALTFHDQIKLDQVASPNNPNLTERERAFMTRSSCDFVIYFKVGKTPLGVIEVDGGSHDQSDQMARDTLKNSILAKTGIAILRLRTVESHIEERIDKFLAQWAG